MARKSPRRQVTKNSSNPRNHGTAKRSKISKQAIRTHLRNRLKKTTWDTDRRQKLKDMSKSSFASFIDIPDLTCPICMELFLMPFSLRCGHIFCFHCLDQLSQHESVCNACPCCRAQIGDNYPTRNRMFESILPQIVKEKLTEEQKSFYFLRKEKMLKEFESRAGENQKILVNQKIDFKVGNRWQVGTVIKIYQKQSKTKIEVLSRYSQIVYVFSSSSTHLAPFATFSKHSHYGDFDYIDEYLELGVLQPVEHVRARQQQPAPMDDANQLPSWLTNLTEFIVSPPEYGQ